jgi:hypothetical protein
VNLEVADWFFDDCTFAPVPEVQALGKIVFFFGGTGI